MKFKRTKKNTDHNHDKYIATPEFNKLPAENFAQANLITKKLTSINRKITSNRTKNLLVDYELKN